MATKKTPPAAKQPPLRTKRKEKPPKGPQTLAIDIGGTGIKALILDEVGTPVTERRRVLTPRPATPESVVAAIGELVEGIGSYQRVAVGFPGVVTENTVYTAPNLDDGWHAFPLGKHIQELCKAPTRVINDADMQGYGAIEGKGVEMVLTLGTGMGSAIFIDGRLVPNLELGHHPLVKGKSYEDRVDGAALAKLGKKKWNARVQQVIDQIMPIWNPRVLYIGGGNAKKIRLELPANVKLVANVAGLLGGIALWRWEES